MLHLVSLAVSADQLTGNEEYDLYLENFKNNPSFEEFFTFTDGGASEDFVVKMDEELDHLPEDVKMDCCKLIFLFLSANYRFSKEENHLLRLLIKES